MTDEHLDPTFRELQAELALAPSPEFAAKVRARVALVPARSWVWGWGLVGASSAVVLTAVVVVVVLVRSEATRSLRTTHAVVAEVASVEAPKPVIADRVVPPTVSPVRTARVTSRRVATAEKAASSEPVIVGEPDQAIAISRYMTGLRSGQRADVTGATPIEVMASEPVVPKLIDIPLIVVDLLPGTPDGRGGGRRNP